MMNGLISIIVPVYNSSAYLGQCLDSILAQSYGNIEVICIDDGSSDDSLKILEEYQMTDSRIKVIKKRNEGVSKARNTGLKASHGEYVLFVDSDDWIDHNTCEIAIKNIDNVDMVMWTYMKEYDDRTEKKEIFYNDCDFSGREFHDKICRRLFGLLDEELLHPENADALCPVWGKLYRKKFISDLEFIDLDTIGTYEDGLFNIFASLRMNSARYIDEPYYHYRKSNDVSITTRYNSRLSQQWSNLYSIMSKCIKDNKLPDVYNEALNNRIAMSTLGLGLNVLSSSSPKKALEIKKIITEEKRKEALQTLRIKTMPIYWKVFYKLAKNGRYHCVYVLLVIISRIIHK